MSRRPFLRSKKRAALHGLLCAGLAALVPLAPAAGEDEGLNLIAEGAPQAEGDLNSFEGKESTEGVYVRDSAVALEKLALAQRMERLKEWNKSADLYQEVLEKYSDRVVPSRTDVNDKIIQYTSVTRGVIERLARWPKEGLDAYRTRFEPAAAAMVEAAGNGRTSRDLSQLHQAFYRYFITDSARSVGLQLIDINLEGGEFQSAARLADELLSWHPNLGDKRPELLYRSALAHRLAGDEGKAQERLATLQKNHAEAAGIIRGKEVKLASSLAAELEGVKSLGDRMGASADSWLTFGGDGSRSRVAPAGGRPGARLFAVPFSKPQWRNVAPENRVDLERIVATNTNEGNTLGVFPVVDRGELFFQDGTRIFARSLESGIALPGWAQTYPGDRDGQYVLPNAVGSPRFHQLTLTLTDRSVLGIMGQPDRSFNNIGMIPAGEARLVCLDRQTGKENWLVTLSNVELPAELPEDQQKSIRALQMNGSPLVVGDNVLVSARGTKQAQFEDAWVLCFQLSTGKFRWSCYLASSSTLGAPWGSQIQTPETTSHLAYANGRIYALSNLGALAALDAYNGTIAWLDIYERGASPFDANQPFDQFNNRRGVLPGQQTRPWVYNPVIVKNGHVFVMPGESRTLYIYDANTGAAVHRITRGDYGNANQLLAVLDDRIVIANDRRVYCVNWKKYDPEKPDDALVWASLEFGTPMRGRPFVTQDSVFVADENRLSRIDLKGGRVLETYPKSAKSWDEKEEGPGNVLVTGDHVVIAGATHVYGFTDLAVARARLDKDVAAAPQDPSPRLRYAEILFTAGESAAAIEKMDEAIKLLGGLKTMRQGVERSRVFNDALMFAQKVAGSGEALSEQATKLTNALYDRAAASAAEPVQQVHYRLSRARFAEAGKDAPTAVTLYQQILSEAELRTVPLLDDATGGPTQAAAVAEEAIASLMERAGKSVYQPFEQSAANDLAEASAATPVKPDRLLAVAQQYPNSNIAQQAMLAAADAYEAAGSPRPAVQVLRQMYFKYPDSKDKPRIIESMARNYLGLPNRIEVAAARLAQGVALSDGLKLTKPLRLPDGREIAADTTFTKALEEVRKFNSQAASKNLPDFRLPVPAKYPAMAVLAANPRWPFAAPGSEQIIADVAALAAPLRDFARSDRAVAWSQSGKLAIYKAGDAQPLGSSPALSEPPLGSAWFGDNVMVWGNLAITLVPERGGKPSWKVELKDLPGVEIVKGGGPRTNDNPQIRQNMINARRNNGFLMQNGQVRALPMPPAARPDPNAPEQIQDVRPVGDRVLVTTSIGRVLCIDVPNGRVAWQTRFTDRPADQIVANEDFTILKGSDESDVRLIAMDTFTGQIRGIRTFNPQQSGQAPGNIALSADGTLVYTLPDRLVLKDLYKPWETPDRDAPSNFPGVVGTVPPYQSASGKPDQLVIAEGRILALAEMGTAIGGTATKKYVRVHSLETGQPIALRTPQNGRDMVDLQLVAGTDSMDVKLRVIGPRLYIINPRTVLCYNLDRPEEFWEGWVDDADEMSAPNIVDAFFGEKHLTLLSQPGQPQPGRKNNFQLLAYARYSGQPGGTAESGRIDYEPMVTESHPITHWQGVDGGFYYVTADGKLHFLSAS